MARYRNIVFIQDYNLHGEERDQFHTLLTDGDAWELAEYMAQWDFYNDCMVSDIEPWGEDDYFEMVIIEGMRYMVSWNKQLGYASLCEELAGE